MPSVANRNAAVGKLNMAIGLASLTTPAGTVSPAVLKTITNYMDEAIELLQQRDPIKRHTSMIILALQDSTEIRVAYTTAGEPVEHVHVKDRELYNWAIKHCHKLAAGTIPAKGSHP